MTADTDDGGASGERAADERPAVAQGSDGVRDAGPESAASASRPPVRPSGATTLQPRGQGPVSFVERRADGNVEWAVFEMDARDVAGAPRERCLVFWREACLRRVWDYPEDWRALGAAGLDALSRHR